MIAIVILGLGLIMVAALFPVAWDRARELSEQTTAQSVAGAAHANVKLLVLASSRQLTGGSFAGDLYYDPNLDPAVNATLPPNTNASVLLYSDNRVHALHLENLPAVGRLPVAEDPWKLDLWHFVDGTRGVDIRAGSFSPGNPPDPAVAVSLTPEFFQRSFYNPQVSLAARVYPPLDGWQGVSSDFDRLDQRRFCWAVLHRLREPVGPVAGIVDPPPQVMARSAVTEPRTFEMYHVTLRRPRATSRYARQDPATAPDPINLAARPQVTPAALAPEEDVLLPMAWRVQVYLSDDGDDIRSSDSTNTTRYPPSNVPTEIEVPPPNFPGNTSAKRMLVQMFPVGTMFVDEISGLIFTVIQRRVVGADGEKAFLTLGREVFLEDLDVPTTHPCHVGAVCIPDNLDAEEQLRTVWVYPPSAEPRSSSSDTFPFFSGSTPVVDITVRTLTLSPSAP